MRLTVGRHVVVMWHALKEKKGNFIPDLIGSLLEMTLLKQRGTAGICHCTAGICHCTAGICHCIAGMLLASFPGYMWVLGMTLLPYRFVYSWNVLLYSWNNYVTVQLEHVTVWLECY